MLIWSQIWIEKLTKKLTNNHFDIRKKTSPDHPAKISLVSIISVTEIQVSRLDFFVGESNC